MEGIGIESWAESRTENGIRTRVGRGTGTITRMGLKSKVNPLAPLIFHRIVQVQRAGALIAFIFYFNPCIYPMCAVGCVSVTHFNKLTSSRGCRDGVVFEAAAVCGEES
ncbi:hypothetical protein EVAR_40139_1 [Eumeta japonica]|uniref:Uncharacterized protein n=1 Tax=Eumeta variegata TaxID=151549 RepID=A0A4C1W972_EUMVA|nr:hypothetical protein EVAR_40139_1 [Eumeta japonica]